jgi:hypothetical protein
MCTVVTAENWQLVFKTWPGVLPEDSTLVPKLDGDAHLMFVLIKICAVSLYNKWSTLTFMTTLVTIVTMLTSVSRVTIDFQVTTFTIVTSCHSVHVCSRSVFTLHTFHAALLISVHLVTVQIVSSLRCN